MDEPCKNHNARKLKGTWTCSFIVVYQYDHLPSYGLSACNDPIKDKCQSDKLCCVDFHPANVDELSFTHIGMADFIRKERCH